MGSSGGGTPQRPNTPAPPANMISPPGQSTPYQPQFTSFLPSDPNAMATGLTPEMLAQITGGMRPPVTEPPRPAGPSPYQQQLEQALAGGRPPGAVPGVPGPGGFGGGAANFGSMMGGGDMRTRGDMLRPQMAQLQGQMRNIPAPTAGAGGRVSPADMAAYQKANAGQNDLRSQLAQLQARAFTGKGRWRLPGSGGGSSDKAGR